MLVALPLLAATPAAAETAAQAAVQPAAPPAAPRAPTRVIAVESVAEPHYRSLVLRGRTEADRRVDLRAEVEGLIATASVRRGTVVAAGDVLCRIAEGRRPADLAEARAALIQAQADFAAAERLSERGFAAQTEALNRQARLEAARAAVMRAELAVERLTIAAPFAGVLEEDTAELGELLQPGGTCATLIAIDPVVLVGYAPEREVDRLAVGMPAGARLVSGREVAGIVRFVARSAEPQTRTFRIEVAVPNPDLTIRDGLTAEILVRLDGVPAHRLPQSALTLGDSGALGVRIAEGGAARFVPVRVIDDGPDGMWVTGLPERAEVIVVGQEFVADGSPVAVSRAPAGALR
jgi:multidrug efflux system membrane fusion protein